MTAALAVSSALAAGLWLVIMTQPLGRPRPDLARRLHRLSAQGQMELDEGEPRDPVFESATLIRHAASASWPPGVENTSR